MDVERMCIMDNNTHCEECGIKVNMMTRTYFDGRCVCGRCEDKLKKASGVKPQIQNKSSNKKKKIERVRTLGEIMMGICVIAALVILFGFGNISTAIMVFIQGWIIYTFISVMCNMAEDVMEVRDMMEKQMKNQDS